MLANIGQLDTVVIVKRAKPLFFTISSVAATGFTSMLVPLAIQNFGGAQQTGAYALATMVTTIALAMQRSLQAQTSSAGISLTRLPLVNSFMKWLPLVAGLLGTATVFLFHLDLSMLLVGIIGPLAVLQDRRRFELFGARLAWKAALSDFLWLLLLLAAIALASQSAIASVLVVLVGQAAGAAIALTVVAKRPDNIQCRLDAPIPRQKPLLFETLVVTSLGVFALPIVAATQSVSALGYVRLAQTVCTIPTALSSALQAVLMPRVDMRDNKQVAGMIAVLIAITGFGLFSVIAGLLFSPQLRTVLNIPSDRTFVATLLVVALGVLLALPVTGALWIARTRWSTRSWLPGRLLASCCEFFGGAILGTLFGPVGLAAGPTINNSVALSYLIGAWSLRRRVDTFP